METVKLENIKVGNRSYNVISDPTYANHLRNDFEPYTCDLINCFSDSEARLSRPKFSSLRATDQVDLSMTSRRHPKGISLKI